MFFFPFSSFNSFSCETDQFIMASPDRFQTFPSKPRVFILSDISNEPDDAESLVRYLLYSNQFQTEGLVACTSTWMKNRVCPQDMHKIVDGYENVVDNLNAHANPKDPYPSADSFRALIKKGAEVNPPFSDH